MLQVVSSVVTGMLCLSEAFSQELKRLVNTVSHIQESEMETEEEVDILMSSDVYSATLSTKSITFSRAQTGWLFREDKTVSVAAGDRFCCTDIRIVPAPCDPALYQSLIIIVSKSAKRRSKHRQTLPPYRGHWRCQLLR